MRNGWPYDYHRSFWDNYYRNYAGERYDLELGVCWPYEGPREESYLWNHESLISPACPACHRASVEAYRDYPRSVGL